MMNINRRSFLSFVIGGAAGTTLSPLPWKMQDDSAIWSQNWPWVPVPKIGEVNYTHSTCTLCPGHCGITVRKIDDRAVKIEGMKGHPVNDGGICILGLSGLQLLYGPSRVKTPLRREGKRGEGKWKKISWDTAISEIAYRLAELRSKGQSHTLGFISGSEQGTVTALSERFMTAYGSRNFLQTPSMDDSYAMVLNLMQGVDAQAGFDFENTDFVLSFGSGIIEGWGSPVRMFRANSRWRTTGGKVVQIEPRLSNTAAKSDKWIPINPGTEADLAFGLAHVIIKQSLYDKDFIDNYSSGFDRWKKRMLDEYHPDKVAKTTGIDNSTIISLARNFTRSSRPLAICGRGRGKTPGSSGEFMAVHALNALVGSINRKGGVWAVSRPGYIDWPEVKIDKAASKGLQQRRVDGTGDKKYPQSRSLLNRFFKMIHSKEISPIQALLVSDANPLYTLPDSKVIKEAFDKIPFVASFSSFMDETAANADLILPNHIYLERYEDVPGVTGFQKPIVGLSRPAVKPQFNTKHVGDVIIGLAKQLGKGTAEAFAWENYENCLEQTMGKMWKTLIEAGFWTDPNFKAPKWDEILGSSSGKFAFLNNNTPTDYQYRPVKLEGESASFPLTLIPYDSMRLANGFIGDPPFVIKTVEDTVLKKKDSFVEINPKTAQAYSLSEGNYATLTTPKGSARVRIHLFDGIMPGTVAIPSGLGHTAYDKFLSGKGVNVNELIGSVEDPVSGLNAVWGIRAKLNKT